MPCYWYNRRADQVKLKPKAQNRTKAPITTAPLWEGKVLSHPLMVGGKGSRLSLCWWYQTLQISSILGRMWQKRLLGHLDHEAGECLIDPAFLQPSQMKLLHLWTKSTLLLGEVSPLGQVKYCVLVLGFHCTGGAGGSGQGQGQGEGSQDLRKQVAG